MNDKESVMDSLDKFFEEHTPNANSTPHERETFQTFKGLKLITTYVLNNMPQYMNAPIHAMKKMLSLSVIADMGIIDGATVRSETQNIASHFMNGFVDAMGLRSRHMHTADEKITDMVTYMRDHSDDVKAAEQRLRNWVDIVGHGPLLKYEDGLTEEEFSLFVCDLYFVVEYMRMEFRPEYRWPEV